MKVYIDDIYNHMCKQRYFSPFLGRLSPRDIVKDECKLSIIFEYTDGYMYTFSLDTLEYTGIIGEDYEFRNIFINADLVKLIKDSGILQEIKKAYDRILQP